MLKEDDGGTENRSPESVEQNSSHVAMAAAQDLTLMREKQKLVP